MSRVALVTGAAGGIGRSCAERLVAEGYTAVSLDRDPIDDPPGPTVQYDLEELDGLEAMLDRLASDVGPVDVLVNNAAMFWPTPLESLTAGELKRIVTVNLLAGTMLAVLTGREMKSRAWGRIIWISSIKDKFGEARALPYDLAKGGVSQATRSLAVELGPHGVLVNAVAPGFVQTPMSMVDGVNELETDWFRTNFIESGRLPLGRPAQPDEIAACVAWLAGDDNSYMNGEIVRIDGGLSVAF